MDIFFTLFTNLLPLYALIALGFVAGKYFEIDRQSLANLAIFICLPIVIFGFVSTLDFKPSYVFLPVIVFVIASVISFTVLFIGRKIYGDERANLLAMCAASGNTGYFGLPIIFLLFDAKWVGVYIFMMLGGAVYEATVNYYIAARGNYSAREAVYKLIKFPTIYAIAAGMLVNFSGAELPDLFFTYWMYFKGAYVVIGMMIVGAALSNVPRLVKCPRFITMAFIGKFLFWPALAFFFVWVDTVFFNLFEESVYRMLIIMSLVPPAANTAAFATQMDLRPEKAATTILVGTVFALFYIPAVLWLIGF